MGCQSCWDYYYRQQKEQYIKDRIARGNEVRKKANEPIIHICKTCGQPRNIRNEAEEVWNAKNRC